MIIYKDKGILETLAEFELFENLFVGSIPSRMHDFYILLVNGKYIVSKQQVKEKLQLKEGDNYFSFESSDLKFHKNSLPDYLQKYSKDLTNNIELKVKSYYDLPVNILTINKTIQEQYDIGKWCELWE